MDLREQLNFGHEVKTLAIHAALGAIAVLDSLALNENAFPIHAHLVSGPTIPPCNAVELGRHTESTEAELIRSTVFPIGADP